MYWDSDEIDRLVRYPIEGSADELGSALDTIAQRDLDNDELMEELHRKYRAFGFDYVPIVPFRHNEYYDVESDEVKQIAEEQYVRYQDIMLDCINILTEYPFVMVAHPDNANWKIVTRADLNTRIAKEYLYAYYAETARAVSNIVELEYDEEEIQDVYEDVRGSGNALNHWESAVDDNVDLHPVEFMSIADLKEVVAASEKLREELEFPSKTKCRDAFDLVEDFRNPIMHGYRTVISSQEDVIELAKSLETASEMTRNAGGDEPGLDIPP
jgi:hypothetical protein